MKILITGGNGMVGMNIRALARLEELDIFAPSRSDLDLFDVNTVQNYIDDLMPDVVIHAAGLVGGIQANISAPYDFCNENLLVGLNVVNASLHSGVKKLINLGSSCMYPRNAGNPLREEDILSGKLEPTNEGYALAKIAVSKLCDYASQQKGVYYKTLIPCNLYGFWDKFDIVKSHMIPAVIRKIDEAKNNNVKQVSIWGDGKARREFMFAEDLADFIIFSLDKLDRFEQYTNVGLGYDHNIKEFYTLIASVIGFNGEFVNDLSKPSGMSQKLVDISQQTSLGWKPKTTLLDGLSKTYKFYLEEV